MHLLISAFIIFHLFLITIWLFPINSNLVNLTNVFRGYIIFLGLDQDYSMFAPAPRKINRHMFALVTFHDQSTAIWSYPRMERLKYWQSMFKERYRKFGNDNIVESCFKMYLPDLARYIARLHACPGNEPDLVSIYVSEDDMIEAQLALSEKESVNPPHRLIKLFTYIVEPPDLRSQ
jgi:hypothetical protein